jgi:PAS domain S-box-containing protein
MTIKKLKPGDAAELLSHTEKTAAHSPEDAVPPSPEEVGRMLHELRSHQFELEMRNEELQRAHLELETARARYFDLYDLAPAGYVTVSERGIILEANLAASTLLGIARGSLKNKPFSQLIIAADRDIYEIHRRRLVNTGEAQTCELRVAKADGTPVWIYVEALVMPDESGTKLYRAILSNIDGRKRTEEALRESEERMRDIIFSMADWVWEVDENGVYTYVSQKGADLLGYSTDEFLGRTPFDFMQNDEARRVSLLFAEIAAGKEPIVDLENWAVSKGGELICLRTNGVPVLDSDGNLKGYRGVDRNITGRKREEEERALLEAQLHQAQKMESVGRLAGGVAHDFNNILSVILGYTEMAMGKLDLTHPAYTDVKRVHRAAERSGGLISQLLTFARKEVIVPKVLDLNDSVKGMLKMLQRLIGENIQLDWRPAVGLWPVWMDPPQIDQILANLCVNARDAIADVGMISISTENRTCDERYCAGLNAETGDYVLLIVGDDGCGMDRETQSHLFEPFFTTKEAGKGTGLGLATVYGAVTQNGGFINVHSEVGRGTVFKIHLPRHAGEVARQTPAAKERVHTMYGNETILVAEDDPDVLQLTTSLLAHQGYTVLAAASPGDAIRLAREHGEAIRLLLTDVIMPEMNGRELASSLVASCPRMKCLFMSGYTDDIIAPHGIFANGFYFIAKPFSLQGLVERVREVLDDE